MYQLLRLPSYTRQCITCISEFKIKTDLMGSARSSSILNCTDYLHRRRPKNSTNLGHEEASDVMKAAARLFPP